jgi:glucosyl-dolichyl phosphate glucuronosyltransferase
MALEPTQHQLTSSVIICCYNKDRIKWVCEAVDSVLKQSVKPNEIVVVYDDNPGVKDALVDQLPTAVKILPNKYQRGLSQARNTGLESSTTDISIFLDDDAKASPDWVMYILASFTTPFVVGVGGKAVPEWVGTGKRPVWFPEELDWTVGCTHTTFGNETKKVRNVFGCNMAFRRTNLVDISGFDFRLGGPISGDDTDICLRITEKDPRYCIMYEPKALIYHKVAPNRQTLKHIAYNSWIQGIGKATTRRIHKVDRRVLASEKGYLKELILKFYPKQLARLLKEPAYALRSMLAVSISILSIGTGYILTRLKINRVNLQQYKIT